MREISFDIFGTENRNTADHVHKHDLFFGTPKNSPTAGIPIGDGDTGSLIWLSEDGINIHVNKCDLWSDAPEGVTWDDDVYCADHEEELTCLKHGGTVKISFSSPLFEPIYQKDFTARLSLSDAQMSLHAETPFGSVKASAFADSFTHVTALKCNVISDDGEAPEISLSRWGSRTLWRWYCQQKFTPETGLDGTNSFADGNFLFITQETNVGGFCIGLLLDFDNDNTTSDTVNKHTGSLKFDKKKEHNFTLYYTVTLGTDIETAKKRLLSAADEGYDRLFERHKSEWHEFWNKSFITFPDDYIENIYYLYLYYVNCESRGAYPPHFTVGLWSFYHDYVPWVYYFHYNMQHMYAPLDASNHGDLALCYDKMRRNGLKTSYLYTERIKKTTGAFFHDVVDRYGRSASYDSLNCTPGSQIALSAWRRYRYSGDENYLKEIALPLMIGSADFYLGMLKKEDDDIYHLYGTTAYEGNKPSDDTLTDIVMIKALFNALITLVDKEKAERLSEVLNHLPETKRLPLLPDDLDDGCFERGIGKGKKPFGDKMIFSGGKRDGKYIRFMKHIHDYGFPDIELSPLYPAGIFGLKDKNGPLFDTMKNQISLGSPGDSQWTMYPVYVARMGMADILPGMLRDILGRFQVFPNGLNAEGSEPPLSDAPRWYNVRNTDTETRTKVDPSKYVHFDFESEPILAQSVNDALIQSHEGVIRICPAVEDTASVTFTLFAEGGFKVDADVSLSGIVIAVENLRGEGFYLSLPERFDVGTLNAYIIRDGKALPVKLSLTMKGFEEVIDFSDSIKSDRVIISDIPIEEIVYKPMEKQKPNSDMKECGDACLGSPRLPK
ncbi:MAG: hypothetical protein K6F09_03450 [Clostridiales bacterium]|nr:hypothetical protein [Clostridiales bacterium]